MTSPAEHERRLDALRAGLRQLGYEEGKNIVIHYRWAEGRYDRLRELAAELVSLNVDVIMTHTTAGARAAKQATSSIPIIAESVADPVDVGLVASLARPGGNLTGLTFFFAELCAKRVELIKEAIPALTRLAVFFNPVNPSHPIALSAMQRTASALGVELVLMEVSAHDDLAAAAARLATRRAQALVLIDDPILFSNAGRIAGFALQHRLPMIAYKPYAKSGALLEYGADLVDLSFRSAAFVDKILKGTPPADLPIERAVKFDLVVNLKTAKTLGIELPTSILLRANEVLE
jgi:putative ABC transport system substrate-binding protein